MNRREFLAGMWVVLGLGGCSRFVKPGQQPEELLEAPAVERPVLEFVPGSWSLVFLPDTQKYPMRWPGIFHLQTQWIVENKDKYNIAYVLTLGDITHNNNRLQWGRANRALSRLDGVVPYTIVLGNHDYGLDGKAKTRDTLADDYFAPSRFTGWATFGGTMEPGRIENSYHLFKAGGQDWLVLCLEWGPRDKTLEWAGKILRKHPGRKAIITTHAYLYSDSTRYHWQEKGKEQRWNPHNYNTEGGVNDGEDMWNKLVKRHRNVFMTINGHVLNDGLGFLVSEGEHRNPVNQMLVNFQMLPVGGGAWLRLLEFLPDGRTIQVKDYSPLYEGYNTGPENQFVIKIGL